jgi:hypothetical protein
MITGNPYQFSIFTKVIHEWNMKGDKTFLNGVLLICIDGNIFPKEVVTATLGREVPLLQAVLRQLTVDREIFSMEKEEAFAKLYHIRHPSDDDHANGITEEYRYHISPDSLADENCYIFAVSDGLQVRFLAAELEYIMAESTHNLSNAQIAESFITNDELRIIISELDYVLDCPV